MTRTIYTITSLFVILFLIQILIFNHIHLFGIGTPFLYIYCILCLPNTIGKTTQVLISFVIGFILDLFSNSPGMNASATLCLGLLNPYLFKMFMPVYDSETAEASIQHFGFKSYFYYAGISTIVHQTVLILIETGTIEHPFLTLSRIGLNSLITLILILVTDSIYHSSK
ncbi:MAG: hypothetical protein PHI48_02065 [Bacteroidales bacterium]|nr:hypothetical protein [Bacteroidales bacterium]